MQELYIPHLNITVRVGDEIEWRYGVLNVCRDYIKEIIRCDKQNCTGPPDCLRVLLIGTKLTDRGNPANKACVNNKQKYVKILNRVAAATINKMTEIE